MSKTFQTSPNVSTSQQASSGLGKAPELSSGSLAQRKPLEVIKTIAASHNSNNAAGPGQGMARGPVTGTTSKDARSMVAALFDLK